MELNALLCDFDWFQLVSFLLLAAELSCDYVQRLGFCLVGERVRNVSTESYTQKFCMEFISYSLTMTSKL